MCVEYVSQDMKLFLQDNGIEAQLPIYTTTGVAERKNRHLLEVTRCLLIGMNVPNLSWDQEVKTASYLKNRMPSRVGRSQITILRPENDFFTVTLRVFGCLCFVLCKKKDKFGSQSINSELPWISEFKEGV